tara:strand:- start:1092 stop:1694 length:603 start_codon:yes stop_codon:yes gene_type:complete
MIGGILQAGAGIVGAIGAGKRQRTAERAQAAAQADLNSRKSTFEGLDTSNPYTNMENTMEDLTINQQESQMINQQGQQQRANIMGQMKGAAGGSGVAALAQAMAQQGQLASQKSAASIGQQESANQKLMASEASRLQGVEREGEVLSRNMERDKASTLLGMAQGDFAGASEQVDAARAAKTEGISSAIGGIGSALTGGLM